MKHMPFFYAVMIALFLSLCLHAQESQGKLLKIIKAEDERRFDGGLAALLDDSSEKIRARAALAAGRIGDEGAIGQLAAMLGDKEEGVAQMAAFALGEIESLKASEALLGLISDTRHPARARAIEAAGKISQANSSKDKEKAEALALAILNGLDFEAVKRSRADEDTVLLGLTAVLRSRPKEAHKVVGKFLGYSDPEIRAAAGNTLARLRAKGPETNSLLREMLKKDSYPVARANAARVLGAAEDAESIVLLLDSAINDPDMRVRISAIRALGSFPGSKESKDIGLAGKLIGRGEYLSKNFKENKNELLEIAASIGRLLAKSEDQDAVRFLQALYIASEYEDPEIPIAWAKISPKTCVEKCNTTRVIRKTESPFIWQRSSSIAQAFGELANAEDKEIRAKAEEYIRSAISGKDRPLLKGSMALPDEIRAFASFKTADAAKVIAPFLSHKDLYVRAAAAETLGEFPSSKEALDALIPAFKSSLASDKDSNDAQMAILSAIVKLDKKSASESLRLALDAPDYLLRKLALESIRREGLEKEAAASFGEIGPLRPYDPKTGTKLGQVLNKDQDYLRAISRQNGKVRAHFTTERGSFSMDLFPEDAPLTVDNFIRLAKSGYFNGLSVHRVVPNFVVQDGDPRGDGNGGPGWQIRCEVNMLPYGRGAVGMALSGKDTGGSQWFVTHSPQPHLDGGYTVFGKVEEAGMKVIDMIARGDRILKVKIIEASRPKAGRKVK